MKLSINSRICWFAPLPALASAAVLLAGPTARSADELRAYWPLDENSGTVVPNESTTADATINSGATWVAGTINNALNFNGVNQYVTGAVTVPLTDTAVSMWFRTTQSGGGLYCATNANRTSYDRDIYLNGGNIHSRIWNVEVISSTGKNYADGEWHQVVHTFGGVAGGQKLYVDGVLVASGNKSASVFNTQTHVQIGYAISSPTKFFNGQLDDVRVWNRALTAAEAQALAQRGGTANYPNPPSAGIIGGAPLKLDWLAPTGATSHDIYLSGSPDIADSTPASEDFMGNFTTKPLDVLDAAPGNYYWRVDERLDSTVFKGPVWSFLYLGDDGGNPINFEQPTAWWVGADESFLQSGVLSGPGIFYKDGPGTLVLTGNNTHSGGTIIRDGVLQIGDGGTSGSLGSGPVTVYSTLVFNRSDSFTFAGILKGSGNVIQNGPGGLTLSGTGITHTGNTILNGGSLTLAGTPGFNSAIQINAGQLSLDTTSGQIVTPKVISGTGSVTINGNGSNWTRFTADHTYGGGTLINPGGMLLLGNITTAGSVLGEITNNGTLGLYHSNAWTFSNNVSGTGAISLYSPGGNPVTVSGNTISLANLNALQNPGGILTNTIVNLTGSLNLSTNSTLTVGPGANVTVAGGMTQATNAYNGTMSTLKVTGGNLTFGGLINDGWDGAYKILQTGGTLTAPGITGGNGGGTWPTNTITLEGGTLVLGASGINGPYYKAPWHGNGGGLTMNINFGGATLSASANWTSKWGVNLTGTNGNLTVSPAGHAITVTRPITGIGGIDLTGSGKLILAGANTYSGTTTVGAGTTFGGAGGMTGPVINNGTLAPGNNGSGKLTVNNTLTMSPDSAIEFQVTDWFGEPGTGCDRIAANSLDLAATPDHPVTIRISTPSPAYFSGAVERTFVLLESTDPIAGFDPAKFVIDATSFTADQGTWSLRKTDNNIELVVTLNGQSIPGQLLDEIWHEIPGDNLTAGAYKAAMTRKPDERHVITTSKAYDSGDQYIRRVRGYITAPVTGTYQFWSAGTSDVDMFLSTSASKFDRQLILNSKFYTLITSYDEDISQKSRLITLTAGQKYFFEIWHKDSAGDSYFSIAWKTPGDSRKLIPATCLSSYAGEANDQDDDDLKDDYELANNLSITDDGRSANSQDGAYGDLDGDGLSNAEELKAGTRVDLADSDADGVNDSDEVKMMGTQALTADAAPFESISTIPGSSYTAAFGSWIQESGKARQDCVRGWLEYPVTLTAAGVYQIDLAFTPVADTGVSRDYEILFSVDGHTVQRETAHLAEGTSGHAKILSPWLAAGNHTLRVFIDNSYRYRRVTVDQLEILAARGPDSNSNDIPDWIDLRLAKYNSVEAPAGSLTSPVCLEGKARWSELTTIAGTNVQPAPNDRWYADVPLNPTQPTEIAALLENGGLVTNRQIDWLPTNLLSTSSLNIRVGDSLKLSAFAGSAGIPAETVILTVEGQTTTITADQPMVHAFNTPGSIPVQVTHSLNGNVTSATATINVIAAPIIKDPVCVVGYFRGLNIPALPVGVSLQLDNRIEIGGAPPTPPEISSTSFASIALKTVPPSFVLVEHLALF